MILKTADIFFTSSSYINFVLNQQITRYMNLQQLKLQVNHQLILGKVH